MASSQSPLWGCLCPLLEDKPEQGYPEALVLNLSSLLGLVPRDLIHLKENEVEADGPPPLLQTWFKFGFGTKQVFRAVCRPISPGESQDYCVY